MVERTFWVFSDENLFDMDPQRATVVSTADSTGPGTASGGFVIAHLERDDALVAFSGILPTPGTPSGSHMFKVPEGWDGTAPLNMTDLRFMLEPTLYATREEVPVVSEEQRERKRKGWAF